MKPKKNILIVEDEKKIADLLSEYLLADGFEPSVLYRGDQVLDAVKQQSPDLLILDIMLPGLDGLTICQELRERYSFPIIMLTSRIQEEDVLLGLKLGADDYICKPFSPREVVARVNTVMRRSRAAFSHEQIKIGCISLNSESRDVTIDGQTIQLTHNEYGILKSMMIQPGKVVSREDLIKKVQGYEYGEYKRTIDTHIKNIRKKIATALPDDKVILSVYGMGYKFNSDLF